MTVSRETVQGLRRLATLVVKDDGPVDLETLRHSEFTERGIPARLMPAHDRSKPNLRMTGDAYYAFKAALSRLEDEAELEHLSSTDIDASLWDFCCEIFLDRDKYQNEPARLERVKAYQENIVRPHADFEIVIRLENVSIQSAFTFDDVRFVHWTERELGEWKRFDNDLTDEFVDKPVAITVVKAGHIERAVARARRKVDNALDALRFGFRASMMIRVQDNHLLMRQGEMQLARAQGVGRWQRWGIGRPTPTELSRSSINRTLTYLEPLEAILASNRLSGKVKERLRLAIHWIGAAVSRRDHDEKVIDLCTAYEALLCDKSDGRKGELITLRAMLLQCAVTGSFTDTFPLLRLYDLRSRLVHGSDIGICGDSHYRFLVGDLGRLLETQVAFFNANPQITTFPKFVKALETPDLLSVALNWFEPLAPLGKDAKDLIAEVKHRMSTSQAP